ncbi:OLC1v1022601C3 [Oldenlandia corymbosa var. corymbosa]|uniref:OLC1v1022601C3 n=1 Tax=Oldenlandia corymbosa var. corymbosa TaxID=529605 RepID=A0AAV1BY71_OLDCO|nr:OLC1v1022601C3 [Oldenlandia corymbosa var. corymbosa]
MSSSDRSGGGAGGGGGGGGGGGRMGVTDQDIAEALSTLLREQNPHNPAIGTLNGIVRHLESKLGLNLSHKIDFIRSQIHLYFQPPPPQPVVTHQLPKDHFVLHHNPNLQQHHSHHVVPSPHHPHFFPPNYAIQHHPQDYGYRPPLQHHLQQQPHHPAQPPRPVVATLAAPTPTVAPAIEAPKDSAATGKKRRGGPGGLNKLCGVSPELQAVVGQATMPRTEIVRQLWAYIRKNNLQDPNNKRKIICNDELRVVFETDCTDMFKMNKLLAKHITALEPTKQTAQNSKKAKVDVESGTGSETPNATDQEVVISVALANFFGTNEREMPQSQVTNQIWEYVKVNQLEVCNILVSIVHIILLSEDGFCNFTS